MKRQKRLLLEGMALILVAALALFMFSDRSTTDPGLLISIQASKNSIGTLSIYNEEKTFNGLTLYPITGTAEVVLLSMKGDVIHRWNVDAERARLMPDGSILVIHGSDWGKDRNPWKDLRQTIRRYAWDGSVQWEYVADDVIHHDAQILASGNIIFIQRALVPAEKKQELYDNNIRSSEMRADLIKEITPDGKLVWEWKAYNHLDLNSCGRRECRSSQEGRSHHKIRDWTHGNTVSILPENKWFDAGDTRFKPGNVLFFPRNWWTGFLIDRHSKKIVWEYGGNYRGGLSGGHELSMIPKDLPGAGNMLLIDNGTVTHKGESFVLEVNPTTKEADWVYDVGASFHTRTRGSVQRLANGNTLISEDESGRVFEVTKEKEIVWEFKGAHEVSRARRYDLSYCPRCTAALEERSR